MDWTLMRPYFSPKEKWGEYRKMQWYHMKMLWEVRSSMKGQGYNWPIVVHCGFENAGHSTKSHHYIGEATDFHFKIDIHLIFQYEILYWTLERLNYSSYTGIGVYPEWNQPGFHLDSRGESLIWMKSKSFGRDPYHYNTYDNIKKILKTKEQHHLSL